MATYSSQSEENPANQPQCISEPHPLIDRNLDPSSQPDQVPNAPDFNPDDISQIVENANVSDGESELDNEV
ncbi:hypothetical protein [Egbenema bharatensis]|uniref:hypothetical protein n=1 Tax=Egbenema bharatensis TaxID=3463334 RepID=UPI003A88D345